MYCLSCGTESDEGAKFCKSCGKALSDREERCSPSNVDSFDAVQEDGMEERNEVRVISSSTKQILGLAGSIILFVGVFTPILSIPIVGSVNYLQTDYGKITLILAIISLVLTLVKKYKLLWITGLISGGLLLFIVVRFQLMIYELKGDLNSELAGNPFRGLADVALQSVQLQWGVAVLVIGTILVIASAAKKLEDNENHIR